MSPCELSHEQQMAESFISQSLPAEIIPTIGGVNIIQDDDNKSQQTTKCCIK